jgi:hypothetical protein
MYTIQYYSHMVFLDLLMAYSKAKLKSSGDKALIILDHSG